MTPLMFVSALVQYNSAINAVSTNARLRWEYQPGSELFVVYNEERNTLAPRISQPREPRLHRQVQSAVPVLAASAPRRIALRQQPDLDIAVVFRYCCAASRSAATVT